MASKDAAVQPYALTGATGWTSTIGPGAKESKASILALGSSTQTRRMTGAAASLSFGVST